MNLIYVDDVAEYKMVVEEASRCLGRWLQRNVNFKFITKSEGFTDLLWLRNGAECSAMEIRKELRSTKCVPSKTEITSTLADEDSMYLLDLEFHGTYLKAYGLDLAMYLVSRGVPRDRILLFSAFADRAFGRFIDDLTRDNVSEPPVFHSYEKESLGGDSQALGERLAWRIMQMRIWEASAPTEEEPAAALPQGVIGASRALHEAINLCRLAATRSEGAVLITGESGTGKEVIAKTLHELSPRRSKPFVALNCAALPETLLESELFGHKKGAFTGAHYDKKGAFQSADGGTLFLDEVGELSCTAQPKLLRALDEGEIRPLGAAQSLKVGVRLISATNRPLSDMIQNRTFREDLYWRISTIRIHLPPLRERREDIVPLAEHFLKRSGKGRSLRFSAPAADLLQRANWPGNVRQLENFVEWISLFVEGHVVSADLVKRELKRTGDLVEDAPEFSTHGSSTHRTDEHAYDQMWTAAIAQLKNETNLQNLMSAFSSALLRVPTEGIDRNDVMVALIWRILVAANWEMCVRADYVRSKRTDGNYGHAIYKLAALLNSLDLSQSEKEALSRAVGKPLPNWGAFKYTGSANPANWESTKKSRVAAIIRTMAAAN